MKTESKTKLNPYLQYEWALKKHTWGIKAKPFLPVPCPPPSYREYGLSSALCLGDATQVCDSRGVL